MKWVLVVIWLHSPGVTVKSTWNDFPSKENCVETGIDVIQTLQNLDYKTISFECKSDSK